MHQYPPEQYLNVRTQRRSVYEFLLIPSFIEPSLSRMSSPSIGKVTWEIDFSELKLLYRIGIGAFGEVFKATFRGTYVAVKRILAKGNNERERIDSFSKELKYLKYVTNECEDNLTKFLSCRAVRHPNVILFVGACLQRENMCIVVRRYANIMWYSLLTHKLD